MQDEILSIRPYERDAVDVLDLEHDNTQRVDLDVGDPLPATAHGIYGSRQSRKGRFTKRLMDLAIALPAAVLTLPVVLVLALVSACVFRAWPFFTQPRLGQGGSTFCFIKVRSLPATASATANKYELEEVSGGRWSRFLRGTHLDELPQLWLVLIGKMSLVGPRPEMPSLAATFDPAFVAERLTVRPGCTGLWQISVDAAGLIGEAPIWDQIYVRVMSMRLDLWILWRTVRRCFGGRPLADIDGVPVGRLVMISPTAEAARGLREMAPACRESMGTQ